MFELLVLYWGLMLDMIIVKLVIWGDWVLIVLDGYCIIVIVIDLVILW